MSEYMTVETSAEAWSVMRTRHPELRGFCRYSYPNEDECGNPSKGKTFTIYGFAKEAYRYRLIDDEATWDIELSRQILFRRKAAYKYWFCCPVNEVE